MRTLLVGTSEFEGKLREMGRRVGVRRDQRKERAGRGVWNDEVE